MRRQKILGFIDSNEKTTEIMSQLGLSKIVALSNLKWLEQRGFVAKIKPEHRQGPRGKFQAFKWRQLARVKDTLVQ